MRKSFLRASAGWQALALLGAGTAASLMVAAPASAQDYTSGAISTRVTNSSGAPVVGAAVTLRSIAQGQVRNFVTDPNGGFTASGLAPGEYAIHVAAAGYQPYDDTLTVTAAQSSSVTVGLVSVSQQSTITVVGRRLRQTATGGTTGLNIDVAAVNANAPLAHDITAITLLAPTVQRGVRGFAQANGEDVPSVGGSSVAENAYYINGLNITNPDTYVGSARVPFYFYKNVDVQTGGYAAEFGRATGGVINATTKSGSNVPFLAMHIDWEPRKLEGSHPNIGLAANPTSIGRLAKHDTKQLTLEGGGAIIPDHLFVYGLVQPQRNTYESATGTGGAGSNLSTFTRSKANDAFWGGKVDAYINPTQHAEFTIFDTRSKEIVTNYHFTPNSSFNGGTIGQQLGYETIKTGGLNWVGRYTGDVTNWLTLSGAYGVSKDAGDYVPADPSAYFVQYNPGTPNTISGQTFSQTNIDDTRRRFYRGDADIRFTAAGQHHIRLGFDNEDLSMNKTTDCNGTLPICYQYRGTYARLTYEHLGGHVTANDTAFYLEDSWQTPLQGLTLNLGIRDDEFRQNNLIGEQTINFKSNWGPRAAFTYSPPSMEKLKVFGSYGRYFIPPAMNLSFRGKDLYFREAFAYPINPATGLPYTGAEFVATQVDPTTGLPLPGVVFGPAKNNSGSAPCPDTPVDISGAPGSPVSGGNHCALFGAGVINPALAKVVPGTKATYEDEFILGARYQIDRLLSVGIQGTYRKLGRVSEDTDFHPQLQAYWCGLDQTDPNNAAHCDFYGSNSTYMIWNVSNTNSLVVNDWLDATTGKITPVTLTKGMHFPTPTRSYKAVVVDFNRADDGRWQASGSVTWSRLVGSTEGTVKSDAGNGAQEDAGSTQDFDYLGLGDYGYGRLPNDHTWQFKLFGALHVNKFLTVGANVFVQSPMPGSCLGYHPYYPQPDVYDPSTFYGAGSHFCSTGPVNANGYQDATAPAPRGTGWKSQWLKQVDVSARINLPFGGSDTRKLVLRADVFNVFNSHAVTQRYSQHENGWSTTDCSAGVLECYQPDPQYLSPLYYQTPRYVRLGLDLLWGGSPPAPAPEPVIAPPPPPPPAAPATQTCADGSVILATDTCPAPPPPPPPPPATKGERGQ